MIYVLRDYKGKIRWDKKRNYGQYSVLYKISGDYFNTVWNLFVTTVLENIYVITYFLYISTKSILIFVKDFILF